MMGAAKRHHPTGRLQGGWSYVSDEIRAFRASGSALAELSVEGREPRNVYQCAREYLQANASEFPNIRVVSRSAVELGKRSIVSVFLVDGSRSP